MKDMSNIVYWYKNEVLVTYYSQLDPSKTAAILQIAEVDGLHRINEQFLNKTPFQLHRVSSKGTMQQGSQTDTGLASGDPADDGIYIFPITPTGIVPSHLPTAAFTVRYSIERKPAHTMAAEAGSMDSMKSGVVSDDTLTVIEHLHQHHKISDTGFSAMPHWFWSGVQDGFHGCPTSPPIPVPAQSDPGYYKMRIQKLVDNSPMLEQTGKGVTVFVLDTLPSSEQLSDPEGVGKNMLWQKMTQGPQAIKTHYLDVPDQHKTAKTGKDIYGRLVGFPMQDHGLTIAGIVRDLAPDAQIECIQVLNEYGVGDTDTLYKALKSIETRMQMDGDLRGKPIVVNLSLVAVPPQADWARFHWDNHPKDMPPERLKRLLKGLAARLQSLANQGVVFVASVGNDSDPRDTMMNPAETRFGPRYPAAFAYEDQDLKVSTIIPVGAVNQDGKATLYSNHPGEAGLGASGGDLPRPDPWMPSAMTHVNARVDPSQSIDAICGVYSSSFYPALSEHDHYPPLPDSPDYPAYQVSPRSTWAYWSGTSFAAPIITALAARALQVSTGTASSESEHIDVRQAIISACAETTDWAGSAIEGKSTKMIRVTQEYEKTISST